MELASSLSFVVLRPDWPRGLLAKVRGRLAEWEHIFTLAVSRALPWSGSPQGTVPPRRPVLLSDRIMLQVVCLWQGLLLMPWPRRTRESPMKSGNPCASICTFSISCNIRNAHRHARYMKTLNTDLQP